MAPARLVAAYFERTLGYSAPRLIVEMALVPFPLKFGLGLIYAALGLGVPTSTTEALARSGVPALIFGGLVLAPLLETLIGQWFGIWLVSRFTTAVPTVVGVSALLFALQHLHVGLAGALTAFPPGIFLSWCFLVGRRQSRWRAYWTTAATHGLHNACAIAIQAAFYGLDAG
jgi:hypothetical protein